MKKEDVSCRNEWRKKSPHEIRRFRGGWKSNRNSLLVSQTYGNGQAWHYEYSDFDDLVRAWTTGGTTGTELRYFYNSEGALVRIEQYATTLSGGNGSDIELHSTITGRTLVSTERYYYDSSNRATRIIREDADNDTYECRWEYDHNNNVTNLVEIVNGQTHTSAYTYDLEQRISQFVNDGVTSGYTYDGFGRLSTQTNGTLNKAYTFYNVQREEVQEDGSTRNVTYATSQIHTLTLDAANYDRTYTYTYDANGNILSVSDGTNTTSYVYDNLNQLVRENNQAAGKTWEYTYDNGGNITSRKEYNNATGALVSQAQYTYGNTHWGDLLTAYKGQTITYDGIGNPLNDGTRTYTWENGRQLASMTIGTTTWSYKYNADGLRTERSNGTVTYDYIYSGSTLIQMSVGDDVLYFTYDASGTPMAVDFNGTKYFYATNLQGDIIAILDTNGNAVVEYTYDAWGNILTATDSTLGYLNPLRYRGYVYDRETKFFYLQSRYYDPELGRFINADSYASTGQGILGNNMFAYCGNNPIMFSDPSGCFKQAPYKIIPNECVPLSEENEYYYIYDQDDLSIASLPLGLGTIGDNGCAVVATYNALLDLGVHVSFYEVYEWYCENLSIWDSTGTNGIFLGTVTKYFREHGYDVVVLISWHPDSHSEYAQNADASIMLYQFKNNSGSGGHYIAYRWTGKDFFGYNTLNTWEYFSSPWEYGTDGYRTFAYEIYIYEKKG